MYRTPRSVRGLFTPRIDKLWDIWLKDKVQKCRNQKMLMLSV